MKKERERILHKSVLRQKTAVSFVGLKLGLQLTLISYRQLISFIFYEPSYEFINHAGV